MKAILPQHLVRRHRRGRPPQPSPIVLVLLALATRLLTRSGFSAFFPLARSWRVFRSPSVHANVAHRPNHKSRNRRTPPKLENWSASVTTTKTVLLKRIRQDFGGDDFPDNDLHLLNVLLPQSIAKRFANEFLAARPTHAAIRMRYLRHSNPDFISN